MYTYKICKDGEGIYYRLFYNGDNFYIHNFSFPTIEDTHVAAFNHMSFRAYWDKAIGRPIAYFAKDRANVVSL